MENVVDKSVLKRQWYMMGYQDAALEILTAVYKAFEEKTDEDSVSSVLDKIAKQYGVEMTQ